MIPNRRFLGGAAATVLFMLYSQGLPVDATGVVGLAIVAWIGGAIISRLANLFRPGPDPYEDDEDMLSPFILFRATIYCQYYCLEHKVRCMKPAYHTMLRSEHQHPVWGLEDGWVHLSLHHYDMQDGLSLVATSKRQPTLNPSETDGGKKE